MNMGVTKVLIVLLTLQGSQYVSATFSFPSFDAGKPLMAALGSLQQMLGLPSMSSRVVKSAPGGPHHPNYATATVGYGTILKNPPPYGAARPVPQQQHRRPPPLPPTIVKYTPYKGGYYPKFKPQPAASYEKLRPAVIDQQQQQQHKPAKEHHFKNHHAYEYAKTESPYKSYTPTPAEDTSSNHNPVIVHQSVRPPIQYYQQPHVATSHQVSNIGSLSSKPTTHHSPQQQQHHHQHPQQHYQQPQAQVQSPHHRSDNLLVDFSRPDPVFAAATMGSDWKPISTPVGGAPSRAVYPSDRRADHVAKQVEPPPTRQEHLHPGKAVHVHLDRSEHRVSDFVDDHPSEEIVSAVVFVKKTND